MSNNGNILGGGDAFGPRRKPPKISNPGRGGAREGSGRKPNVVRRLIRDYQAEGKLASEALELCMALMRDKTVLPKVRLDAAREILDRMVGRAKQTVDVNTGNEGRANAAAARKLLADPVGRELLFQIAERSSALVDPERIGPAPDEPTAATG